MVPTWALSTQHFLTLYVSHNCSLKQPLDELSNVLECIHGPFDVRNLVQGILDNCSHVHGPLDVHGCVHKSPDHPGRVPGPPSGRGTVGAILRPNHFLPTRICRGRQAYLVD